MATKAAASTPALLAAVALAACATPPIAGATPEVPVAYVSVRNNTPQIYVTAGAGSERPLTPGTAASQPAWSPDGSRLAYLRYGGGRTVIELVDLAGGPAKRLTGDEGSAEFGAAWSPDGKSLAFVSKNLANGKTTLVIKHLAGDAVVTIAPEGEIASTAPQWSADGRKLAFMAGDKNNRPHVHVVGRDGEGLRNVSGGAVKRSTAHGALSPDGRRVAYVADMREAGVDLLVTDLETGQSRNLTEKLGARHESPRWSPDGTRIAFVSNRDDPNRTRGDIFVMNADGSGVRNLTRHPHEDFDPAWTSDGRTIVFTSLRTGSGQIFAVDVDTGETRRITQDNHQSFDQAPRPIAQR